jgi:hypothetical protein
MNNADNFSQANADNFNLAIELTKQKLKLMSNLHESDKVYVMYGEFDPFTARHEAILRELILQATMAEMKSDGRRKVAIVMVVEDKPSYSGATALSQRIRMVEMAAYHQTCIKVFETMADYVFDYGTPVCLRFDTPTIGSVLELTPKDVTDVVALVNGMEMNGMVEEVPIHRVINAEDLDASDVESLRDIISKHTGIDRDDIKVAGFDEE